MSWRKIQKQKKGNIVRGCDHAFNLIILIIHVVGI